jgi:hypothetical protein
LQFIPVIGYNRKANQVSSNLINNNYMNFWQNCEINSGNQISLRYYGINHIIPPEPPEENYYLPKPAVQVSPTHESPVIRYHSDLAFVLHPDNPFYHQIEADKREYILYLNQNGSKVPENSKFPSEMRPEPDNTVPEKNNAGSAIIHLEDLNKPASQLYPNPDPKGRLNRPYISH